MTAWKVKITVSNKKNVCKESRRAKGDSNEENICKEHKRKEFFLRVIKTAEWKRLKVDSIRSLVVNWGLSDKWKCYFKHSFYTESEKKNEELNAWVFNCWDKIF